MHRSELTSANALEVEAVDTTGAGDTFVGYYLASIMEGLDDQLALQRSCAAAALSVTKQGATPSIPLSNEVDTLLQNL
jgi:ribokinase